MYKGYQRFESVLSIIEEVLVVIPYILIFVTVIEQVFQRYFNLPIADTSEISMISMAIFTFFGMGFLTHTGGHITIEVHKMIKNFKVLAIVEAIAYAGMIVFSIVYLWLGWDLFQFAWTSATSTTQLRIPLVLPYGAMLIGFVMIILHSIGKLIELYHYRKNPEELLNVETNIEELR